MGSVKSVEGNGEEGAFAGADVASNATLGRLSVGMGIPAAACI